MLVKSCNEKPGEKIVRTSGIHGADPVERVCRAVLRSGLGIRAYVKSRLMLTIWSTATSYSIRCWSR
jgi:hypothetical protein